MNDAVEFDYVIGGAGSAGCVLARRLADAGNRVLLIEAGPRDNAWVIRMPAGLRSIFKPSSRYNYWFQTEPQSNLDNRRIQQPRGRVLGGSSSINGMTWLRGHPLDYDRWEREGAQGWGWKNCLPYFRRIERSDVGGAYRGAEGFIHAQRQETLCPLNQAFLDAGVEAGYPLTDDVNGYRQEGVSRFEMSVDRGIRNSASYGYLHSRKEDGNLTVWTQSALRRINFDGNTATGFEVLRGGSTVNVIARKETLLCAGVFGSPQLLMLSGIGPGGHLKEKGVQPRVDLPGVGLNLQDHLECHIQIETKEPVSLNQELRLHKMLLAGVQWFACKSGVASVNQCHVGAFLKSGVEIAHPDIQFHFFPVFFDKNWIPTRRTNGYRIGVGPMRPTSRGHVRLKSADVDDPLLIDPNYMDTEEDWRVMREAVRLGLLFSRQPAFRRFHHREDMPGEDVSDSSALDRFIRADASSAYHPCGTCRMGAKDDRTAVVDSDLKVRGVERLRVIDASVMPSVPSANINAATIMLAERASDLVLGRPALQAEWLAFAA
ncbi:choline dehydrogenase [Caballeronia cordobensis]|uniref:Choline dehydrogenase n=1 Tax=Caballeronia cordobensis TaxID=1353886 RepID=A0A158GD84_CABCO|nr:choline dehydrogenase [Caballeronia cordobensis]SAL29887.1 choline dehydrogenase [Caballeronia cordobensis]